MHGRHGPRLRPSAPPTADLVSAVAVSAAVLTAVPCAGGSRHYICPIVGGAAVNPSLTSRLTSLKRPIRVTSTRAQRKDSPRARDSIEPSNDLPDGLFSPSFSLPLTSDRYSSGARANTPRVASAMESVEWRSVAIPSERRAAGRRRSHDSARQESMTASIDYLMTLAAAGPRDWQVVMIA